jgi:hypothetical protein
MMLLYTSIVAASSILLSSTVQAHDIELQRTEKDVKIPKPISDHTATLAQDNLIYIAGGCDDPNGNVLIQDGNATFFACNSISDSFYSFDPVTETFTTLPNLPSPRYRHAAAAVNNKVWIVGGRNLQDSLVIDVSVSRLYRFHRHDQQAASQLWNVAYAFLLFADL